MESSQGSSAYPSYQRELERIRMVPSVRTGVLFVLGLNTLFMLLDVWWADPERYRALLISRLGLDVAAVALWFAAPLVRPLRAAIAGMLITGTGMITFTVVAGGVGTDYWPALMLLFLGIPVMLPLSGRQAAVPAVLLLVAFACIPVIAGETIEARRYLVPLFFSISGAFVCVAACALLDGLRFLEFQQRGEVQRAHDELAQLDKAKSRFTANIHHELRTPLTLMLAPLEGMLAGDFGDMSVTQEEYLRTMHVNGLRLLKLINNLLDLAKVESGQLEVRRSPCQLGQLVGDVVSGARPLAEQKGIELVATLEEAPLLFCDHEAIEKVVINLLGNALKFTESGGRIELAVSPEEDGAVHLAVIDSGVGLDPGEAERIFDRFAQADTSATRKHEGTGIGLSLAKELVEVHGGRIWAESEGPGRGTEVHVVLPRGDADAPDQEEVVRTGSGEAVALARSFGAVEAELNLEGEDPARLVEMERSVERWKHQKHDSAPADAGQRQEAEGLADILIVEDNADMRRLLTFVVGREFSVRTARNGREGLDEIRRHAPDLVLTDVMMPEMSGTELCRAIKSDPATEGLPVILVTSKAEREMKIEGLEGGADDYVTKPFHPRELLARVRSFVHLHQLQRDLAERNQELEHANRELERAMADLKEAEVQVLQSERLAAVGELAAGVAHEVNNPVNFALNAMRAAGSVVEAVASAATDFARLQSVEPDTVAEELRRIAESRKGAVVEEAADELRELVGIVVEGLERTHRLVGNLRDLAGLEQGGMHSVDLRRGVESTVRLMGHQFERAGVQIETDLADDLVVHGDAGALNQVLLNLLKNSAEAMEGSSGSVRIEGRREGDFARIEIQDDGPGILDGLQGRLFDPFFTTKEAGRGSGLGLAICRRIVTEHGGTIMLSSPPGEGASFVVRLPLAPPGQGV